MNENELKSLISDLEKEYVDIKAKKLELNMARGKPNFDQLDSRNWT